MLTEATLILWLVLYVDRGYIDYVTGDVDRGCTHYPEWAGNNYSVEETGTCQESKTGNSILSITRTVG